MLNGYNFPVSRSIWGEKGNMGCKSCQSIFQRNYSAEIGIHFPGLQGWISLSCGCFRSLSSA